MTTSCVKCGSDHIVPRAAIWDQGRHSSGRLHAYVYSNPEAIFFPGTVYATLYARICGDCGYTEIYAEGADELYQAYLRGTAGAPPVSEQPEPPAPVPDDACLSCGKSIPAGAPACPACGWTWEATD